MKVKPLFDNVLIEPLEAEEKTASGIILPESAKEKPQMGKVVAVGNGKVGPKGETHPMTVKAGDTVMYKKWGGNDVIVEGKDMMIVEEKDILAIMA